MIQSDLSIRKVKIKLKDFFFISVCILKNMLQYVNANVNLMLNFFDVEVAKKFSIKCLQSAGFFDYKKHESNHSF